MCLGGTLFPHLPCPQAPSPTPPGSTLAGPTPGPAVCLPGTGVRGRHPPQRGGGKSVLLSPLGPVTSAVAARLTCSGQSQRPLPGTPGVQVAVCLSPFLRTLPQLWLLFASLLHLRSGTCFCKYLPSVHCVRHCSRQRGYSRNRAGWRWNYPLSSLGRTALCVVSVSLSPLCSPSALPTPTRWLYPLTFPPLALLLCCADVGCPCPAV